MSCKSKRESECVLIPECRWNKGKTRSFCSTKPKRTSKPIQLAPAVAKVAPKQRINFRNIANNEALRIKQAQELRARHFDVPPVPVPVPVLAPVALRPVPVVPVPPERLHVNDKILKCIKGSKLLRFRSSVSFYGQEIQREFHIGNCGIGIVKTDGSTYELLFTATNIPRFVFNDDHSAIAIRNTNYVILFKDEDEYKYAKFIIKKELKSLDQLGSSKKHRNRSGSRNRSRNRSGSRNRKHKLYKRNK